MKIALLSNVNMNFVIRSLKGKVEIYEPEGYGNELGLMQNPASSYHAFAPDITFLVMDYMEVLGHCLQEEKAKEIAAYWFATLENVLEPGKRYYISDARLWGSELLTVEDAFLEKRLLRLWDDALFSLCQRHANVRVFPYGRLADEMGTHAFYAPKTWYLGRILHSSQAQRALADQILEKIRAEQGTPKKVLVLDLDNTLWGGLAGEADHTPIRLSEEHEGLAYKNLQRVLLQMQRQGVLLAVSSKNNEEDVREILEKHPHMALRPECFAAMEINWEPKPDNIRRIAKTLNLGLDAFVFFDDSPAEREAVQRMLPEVSVPAFPDKPEELAPAMVEIYREYFQKAVLTKEDLEKTAQYAANEKRARLKTGAGSFTEYLEALQITVVREEAEQNADRLLQLLNKTNQFNLTTVRHTMEELQEILQDPKKRIYLFRVTDAFGDNGLVAAMCVELSGTPVLSEFVMSCRVMGRNIEYALMDYVERELLGQGYSALIGRYVPTPKNRPVEKLYETLGYACLTDGEPSDCQRWQITLGERPPREYVVSFGA